MLIRTGKWCVWLVVAAGLLVAAASGVSEEVPAIHSLCLGLAGECRETAQFVMFGMPVWVWGAVYYLSLAVVLAFAPQWTTLLVGAGLGGELALVWIMIAQRLFCPICLANLVVVLLLAAVALAGERPWRTATVCLLALLVSHAAVVRGGLAPDRTAAGERLGQQVVAEVGGATITEAELETSLAAKLVELRERIYRLERDRLDTMVRDRVQALEAAARGMGVPELLDAEALSKAAPVTDAEVKAMAEESRADLKRFNWSEQELLDRIRNFLTRTRRDAAIRSYAESLFPKYGVRILLSAPQPLALAVDPGDSPRRGPANAKVTVTEFSDYQCPACRRGHDTVLAIREKYRDRVRWVFKDSPLAMHQNARSAAEAARCGEEQGKFWEIQEMLYTSPDLSRERYLEMAGELGLDRERFAQCLDAHRTAPLVDRDLAEATRLGLDATPVFIVNGRLMTGTPSPEKFSEVIDQALAAAGSAGN